MDPVDAADAERIARYRAPRRDDALEYGVRLLVLMPHFAEQLERIVYREMPDHISQCVREGTRILLEHAREARARCN
jgi:hypothetical protein